MKMISLIIDGTTVAGLIAAMIVFFAGCSSTTRYVEGTSTSLGTYIPYDGSVYGLEIVQYLSGCKVVCPTNQPMSVEREFCASNSYFGIVHTSESSKTKVNVQK